VRSFSVLVAALSITLTSASPARAFENVIHGATASFGFGTTPVGDTIMGELGGDWLGLRASRDLRWVMQWEVLATVKGGYLGSEHPFLFLIGPHLGSWVEGGVRTSNKTGFSPYFGARIGGDVQLLGNPDVGHLDQINSVDGVGGVTAQGWARLTVGGSYLDARRSVILVAFLQELLQPARINTPSHAFTGFGASLRVDSPRSVIATLEGGFSLTPSRDDALRGLSDTTTRAWIGGSVRKIFENGMWIGGALTYERDMDHVVYASNGTAFDTADAPRFNVSIFYGLPLWRSP
jgi:hypothetical protein